MTNRYVLDIESDGLLDTIKNIWCIVLRDIDTDEVFSFINNDLSWQEKVVDGVTIVGHNIVGYDLIAIRKIYGWTPSAGVKIHDTMLMSQTLDYNRFGGKHSLAKWGEYLNCAKFEFDEWDKFSQEMLDYCIQDTKVNVLVYKHLLKELSSLSKSKPLIKTSLRNEHTVAQFCADAEYTGWLFDKERALELQREMEAEMAEVEQVINPKLKLEIKPTDKTPKSPKWIKNGNYDAFTARYFGVSPESGQLESRIVEGPYSRIEFVQPDIGNIDSVKLYLKTIGWVPDDWNWKKIDGQFVKVSEKLTTSSLEKLGEIGMLIDKYYTIRSRHSILSTWISNLDSNNRLHGSCFTIATPTGRARHSGIVNVPSADSVYGPDIRKLFIATPGYTIIGADSSGNQMRALLHYLKNDEYTDLVLNGDVHSKNASVLSQTIESEVPRSVAKRFLYAFLFGAGDEKAALTVTGLRNKKIGKKIREVFTASTPGLATLISKINKIYDQTDNVGDPWIPCVDGRRIYTDSRHKALNYLLQSMEAVTCKGAVAMLYEELKQRNIPFNALIFYHDEVEFEVPDAYAEEAAAIAKRCFQDAPKLFGVTLMDGESKIGKTWYDVH